MNVTCPNCATVYRVDPAKVPAGGVRARCNVCSAVFAVRNEGEAEPAAATAAQQSERRPPEPVAAKPEPPSSPAQPEFPKPPAPSEPLRSTEPVATVRLPSPATSATVPPSIPASRPAAPQRPTMPASGPVAPAGIAAPANSSTARPGATLSPPAAAPQAARPPVAPPPPAAAKPATPPAAPPSGPALRTAPASVTGGRPANPFLSQDPALKARRLARALISDMVVYHPGKRQEGLRDGNLKALFDEEIKKSWEEYAEQVGREVADSTPYFREALNEILAGGRQIF
jgi:predicted Zn finger-like uncharacterized protein